MLRGGSAVPKTTRHCTVSSVNSIFNPPFSTLLDLFGSRAVLLGYPSVDKRVDDLVYTPAAQEVSTDKLVED